MTHLRKLMLDELERRNYTDSTRRAYLRIIDEFARHFDHRPDQLGPAQIREYAAHLFRDIRNLPTTRSIILLGLCDSSSSRC